MKRLGRLLMRRGVVRGVIGPLVIGSLLGWMVYQFVLGSPATEGPRALARDSLKSGTELVALVITASFCAGKSAEGFQPAIQKMLQVLNAQAAREEKQFRSIGVALDHEPSAGIETLAQLARFDEVVAGGNWLNLGALHYIWRQGYAEPSIPQVVVLEREVDIGESAIQVSEERTVAQKVGAEQIIEWGRLGFGYARGDARAHEEK